MKNIFKALITIIVTLLLTSCFRNDIRTEVYKVEHLQTRQAAQQLIEYLQKLADPKKNIHINLDDQTVTIEYDSKLLSSKNIEYAIIEAGFDLPDWPKKAEDRERLLKKP